MGFGSYCTIADIKGVLGITATTDDTVIRKIAEAASRAIDRYTNRFFYTQTETKYFDGALTLWTPDLLSVTWVSNTTLSAAISSTTATTSTVAAVTYLSAGDTILIDSEQIYISSISSLTLTITRGMNSTTAATHSNSATVYTAVIKTDEDGDGTFENTLYPGDFFLYGAGGEDAFNLYPKVRIEINPNGDYGSFANGVKKGVQIAGVWGYGDGISATPYVADTTITEDLTAGEAAIDVTAVTNLSAGNVILIGSEQYYIYSIATLTLTVEAGVNGTTEATHSSGATIYIYQYPADIRQACIDLGVALYQNRAKKGIQSERLGDYSYTMSREMMNSILEDSIKGYRRLRF